jgi:hypothetical protein
LTDLPSLCSQVLLEDRRRDLPLLDPVEFGRNGALPLDRSR